MIDTMRGVAYAGVLPLCGERGGVGFPAEISVDRNWLRPRHSALPLLDPQQRPSAPSRRGP